MLDYARTHTHLDAEGRVGGDVFLPDGVEQVVLGPQPVLPHLVEEELLRAW